MKLFNKKLLKSFQIAIMMIVVAPLSACVSLKSKTDVDGPPVFPRSVKHIPDAIPKMEAKSKYGNPDTYSVFGKTYRVLENHHGFEQTGMASWYGTKFHGKRTSSGEPYDMYAMTAAHPTLPIPCYAKVTNVQNGKTAIVKINDRGPFKSDRIMDLSYAAAHKLGVYQNGTSRVNIQIINSAEWDHDLYLAESKQKQSDYSKHRNYLDNNLDNNLDNDFKINNHENDKPGLYLQLAAFKQKSNAHAFAHKMKDLLHSHPIEIKLADSVEQSTYRVRIGPFNQKQEALAVADLLKNKKLSSKITEVF